MAKSNTTAPANKDDKARLLRRFAEAEQAVGATMQLLGKLLVDDALAATPLAEQYVRMCNIHYRKIRNGKVISHEDYQIAVDLCTAARRALRAIDDSLQFADHPRTEALQSLAASCHQVLMTHYNLSTKPGRPLPP